MSSISVQLYSLMTSVTPFHIVQFCFKYNNYYSYDYLPKWTVLNPACITTINQWYSPTTTCTCMPPALYMYLKSCLLIIIFFVSVFFVMEKSTNQKESS